MDLSINLCSSHPRGLHLNNPVMVASGTFGYGNEFSEIIDIKQLGAIVCKGTTLEPRSGNPQPRLVETSAGLLNSIGLQNIGVAALIEEKAPIWATWPVPVIVNIAGETVEEYRQLAQCLNDIAGVAALEVNISCPNVKKGGQEFGSEPRQAATVTEAVKASTSLPVIVKLTPNVSDIVSIAKAVAQAGADALTLVNTLRGMVIDIEKRRPLLGGVTGGLSGHGLKPVALAMVYTVYKEVNIPIIGCGGIYTTSDALEFFLAGAKAVQVGSASFINPGAAINIVDGIEQWLKDHGMKGSRDLVGLAHQSS